MIVRAFLQSIIRYCIGVFSPLSFAKVTYYSFARVFIKEMPGIIGYLLIFFVLQWVIKKYNKLNLRKQIILSIIVIIPIARFWFFHDIFLLLNYDKFSVEDIIKSQLGGGLQLITFLIFSIVFAVLQYFLIEKKHQASHFS